MSKKEKNETLQASPLEMFYLKIIKTFSYNTKINNWFLYASKETIEIFHEVELFRSTTKTTSNGKN